MKKKKIISVWEEKIDERVLDEEIEVRENLPVP